MSYDMKGSKKIWNNNIREHSYGISVTNDYTSCSTGVKFTNSGLSFYLFYFLFLFLFCFIFYFLFLEKLGLGLIGYTVTSVTTWWHSHKIDHKTWENLVEDSRTDDVIQHGHHILASWTTHGCLE